MTRRVRARWRGWLGLGVLLAFAACMPSAAAAAASRLILLGTAGGPTPKPNRFPSAYAIVAGGDTILVDAGNGVAQQLVRAGVAVNTVRHVFLTHHHSDHNADIGTLPLLVWASDPGGTITVWGPPPLAQMMRQFRAFQHFDIDTRTEDEGRLPYDQVVRVREFAKEGLLLDTPGLRVRCVRNRHPPIVQSYAFRVDLADRSYVFSGDTTYAKQVAELAKGADILVHEIMLPSALEALIAAEPGARTLRRHLYASHSTPEQVGRVATEAGVKTLVLSHFVPGGPGVDDQQWLDAVRPYFTGEIIVGRDLMQL